MLTLNKDGIWKQQRNINFMSVAKAKASVKDRNAFHAGFFMQKFKSHIRQEESSLLQCRQRRLRDMREPKYCIVMNEYERRIIINSLNNLRNKLIAGGRYTDAVDDVLVKIIMRQSKNSKSWLRRFRLWGKQYLSKWAELITRKTGILSPTLPPEEEKPNSVLQFLSLLAVERSKMNSKQSEKITALYCRLSRDDE